MTLIASEIRNEVMSNQFFGLLYFDTSSRVCFVPAGKLLNNVDKSQAEQKGQKRAGAGKRLEISLVEGSFRRIAGIREFADASGMFLVRTVEILREPGKSLGFYVQQGDGWERKDGVFVSRVNLGSIVETNGLLSIGDEITKVNNFDVTKMPLKDVAVIMRYVTTLILTVKVLTSPALLRTYSMRRPITQKSSTTSNTTQSDIVEIASQPRTSTPKAQPRLQSLRPNRGTSSPSANRKVANRRVVVAEDEAVAPYAYTTITRTGDSTPASHYEPICSVPLEKQQPVEGGWISTESLRTLGSRGSEELNVSVIDYEHIDQSRDTQQYSGQLTLTLDMIDNLIPPSDDAPLLCSIAIDSESTVQVTMPVSQLKEEVRIEEDYHVHLTQSHRIIFNFVNGLLSSTKTIPLTYFIPKPDAMHPRPEQAFALTLSPIGRLRFNLDFCPLPEAVPRWANPAITNENVATLRELSISNPNASGLPLVVERGIQVIQEYGIETAGLYQVTASEKAKSQAFSACLSQTLHPSQLRSLVSQVTVHAFTGVLKDFFLNLPEPFFSPDFATSLQDAMQFSEGASQHKGGITLSSFVECLPDEANATTCALLTHFRTVCQHGATNKTTVDKIAHTFAPLLFTPAHSQREGTENFSVNVHTNILKTLILQQK